MTDKQKEAIRFLYNLRATIDESIMLFDEDINVKCGKETIKQITTVLNLIQTQQAEIEHQKERRENQKKELSILNEKQKEFNKLRNTVNSYRGQFKRQQAEIEKKDKIIDEIQKEVRDHIGFENRLKRDNKEPDLFNQGRFYVANNINNILKGKVENG